jgi:hypothetical protein
MAVGLGVAAPVFMGRALDGAIASRPAGYLAAMVLACGFTCLISDLIRNWLSSHGDISAFTFSEGKHLEILGRLLNKTVAYHHETKRSELNRSLDGLDSEILALTAGGLFDTMPNVLSSLIVGVLGLAPCRHSDRFRIRVHGRDLVRFHGQRCSNFGTGKSASRSASVGTASTT